MLSSNKIYRKMKKKSITNLDPQCLFYVLIVSVNNILYDTPMTNLFTSFKVEMIW